MTKFTTTAARSITARIVGPNLSSNPAWPLARMLFARQWYVTSAYSSVKIDTAVKKKAEMKAGRSPKLSMPSERAPRMTVKLSQERNVRSFAKKTLGSTRVGRAMRLPAGFVSHSLPWECRAVVRRKDLPCVVWRRGWLDMLAVVWRCVCCGTRRRN